HCRRAWRRDYALGQPARRPARDGAEPRLTHLSSRPSMLAYAGMREPRPITTIAEVNRGRWWLWVPAFAGMTVRSEQPAPVRHLLVRSNQHHPALFVGKAERQHFRHHRTDLARREIDHRRHLTADQNFRLVVFDDLRRRFAR